MLSTFTGLLTLLIGIISSAAVAQGATGYVRQFIDASGSLIVAAIVIGLGLLAVWGILESVLLASLFTLMEVGGPFAIIVAATY